MIGKSERRLMAMCLLAAKANAPIDTGLLRHRAIKVRATHDGFKITWDGRIAYYLGFVNEGIKGNEKNAQFIENSMTMIENMVVDYYAGDRDGTYARARAFNNVVKQGFNKFDVKKREELDNLTKLNNRRYQNRMDEYRRWYDKL